MNYLQLNNQVSVSGQLSEADIPMLVDNGIELLVCNRPNDEDEGQVCYQTIFQEAEKHGIQTELLAFSSYQITEPDRDALIELIKRGLRTHLYCRSGARSKRLWRAANEIGRGGHDFFR